MAGAAINTLPISETQAFYIRVSSRTSLGDFCLQRDDDEVTLGQLSNDNDNQKWVFTKCGPVDKKKGVYSLANLGRLNRPLGRGQNHLRFLAATEEPTKWNVCIKERSLFRFDISDTSDPESKLILTLRNGDLVFHKATSGGGNDQLWRIVTESTPNKEIQQEKPCGESLVIAPGQKYFIRNWHDALTLTLGNASANKKATDEVYVSPHVQPKTDPGNKIGQVWIFDMKSDGNVTLYNSIAQKYLTVPDGKDNVGEEVRGSSDGFDTEWKIRNIGGFAATICLANTNLALGFPRAKVMEYDKVFLMSNVTAQNQIWFFEPVSYMGDTSKIEKVDVTSVDYVKPGLYNIKNAQTGKFLFDSGGLMSTYKDVIPTSIFNISGHHPNVGTYVTQRGIYLNITPSGLVKSDIPQPWRFLRTEGNIYSISLDADSNPPTFLTTTKYDGGPDFYDNVVLQAKNNENSQHWYLCSV